MIVNYPQKEPDTHNQINQVLNFFKLIALF